MIKKYFLWHTAMSTLSSKWGWMALKYTYINQSIKIYLLKTLYKLLIKRLCEIYKLNKFNQFLFIYKVKSKHYYIFKSNQIKLKTDTNTKSIKEKTYLFYINLYKYKWTANPPNTSSNKAYNLSILTN